MTWPSALATGLVCALVGALAAGSIANLCVTWYHVSQREGFAGYFVIYWGLGGALLGLAAGVAITRLLPARPLPIALGAVILVAAVAALIARLGGDVPPRIAGDRLMLQVELRAPESWQLTNTRRAQQGSLRLTAAGASGHTASGNLPPLSARQEQQRWILPGSVFVFTTRGRRHLAARLGSEEVAAFDLPLPPHPGRAELTWSPWTPAAKGFEVRYRVEPLRAQPAAPAPAGAPPEDAPLADLLPFAQDASFDIRQRVFRAIQSRPTELIPLLTAGDATQVDRVLYAATGINPLPDAFEPPLLHVLDSMRAELARLRQTAEVQHDPDHLAAVALQRRFINWFTVWKNAHRQTRAVPPALTDFLNDAAQLADPALAEAREIGPLGRRYLREWQ